MKKVDLLVLRSFIGPFFMTFFVVVFLHVMQFFFVYIDDFVGKGLEWYIVAELIFYLSANTVPLALPLAVLLSSIMTYGNLGERYELTALKSAGIGLLQFMRFSIVIVFIISLGSLAFSNYVLPTANLKFYTTLLDITQQKPALNIREDVYYRDIEDYVIKINKKGADNRSIHGVYISNRSSRSPNHDILLAEDGEMFTSRDQRYLILKLFNGGKYEVLPPDSKNPEANLHVRTYFAEMEKVFDLSDFKMSRTNEEIYRDHYVMMNIAQLNEYIDSLKRDDQVTYNMIGEFLKPYFYFKRDSTAAFSVHINPDTIKAKSYMAYLDKEKSGKVFSRAISFTKTTNEQLEMPYLMRLESNKRFMVRGQIELHRKFMLAAACLVLLFFGAPFGALIRKGGFGYPVVVSVIFYIFYFALFKTGESFAKKEVTSAFIGMWLPTFIMLPMTIFVTYKAMNDSPLLNKESYSFFIKRLIGKYKGKRRYEKDTV